MQRLGVWVGLFGSAIALVSSVVGAVEKRWDPPTWVGLGMALVGGLGVAVSVRGASLSRRAANRLSCLSLVLVVLGVGGIYLFPRPAEDDSEKSETADQGRGDEGPADSDPPTESTAGSDTTTSTSTSAPAGEEVGRGGGGEAGRHGSPDPDESSTTTVSAPELPDPPPTTTTSLRTTAPPTTARRGPTWTEQQGSLGANTFLNPANASGQGPRIEPWAYVEVSCKVHAPQIESANPDGYWYRIASPPWNNNYYAVANTFWNGDTPDQPPYTHNTDFNVPDC